MTMLYKMTDNTELHSRSRIKIKTEPEIIDNYQADLESILYYTKAIQNGEVYSLTSEIKEELNIVDYNDKYGFCNVEAISPQKDSDPNEVNYKNWLNSTLPYKVPHIPKNGNLVVQVKNNYQDCNFKSSGSSALKIQSQKHLRKPKKIRKNHFNTDGLKKQKEILLEKETKKINAYYKKCFHCSYASKDKEDWSQHRTLFHSNSMTRKCQFCEFNTNSALKFRIHVKNHTVKPTFKCQHCIYQTVTSSHLKRHINSIHTKSTKYPCQYCDFVATSFISVRKHIEEEHEKIVISGKLDSQNEPKVQHITELLKLNDSKVDSSGAVFARRARNVKGQQFQCQYCEYQTPFSDYLNIHINSRHTQNILYKCQYCEYNATKLYTLRCHVNSKHTKKFVYKCELCNLETTRSNILKRHIERIHIKKSFKCQYCDYEAKKEGHIGNHLRRKHRIHFRTEQCVDQIKIESELVQIENIKFEPELIKCENI